MRNWLVRPELMCGAHRVAEHLECHMLTGSMQMNKGLKGFYANGLFWGPAITKLRHDELASYISGHRSSLDSLGPDSPLQRIPGLSIVRSRYPDRIPSKEEITKSRVTLITRCKLCRRLHLDAKISGHPVRYDIP